jgi:hypothetical protein
MILDAPLEVQDPGPESAAGNLATFGVVLPGVSSDRRL